MKYARDSAAMWGACCSVLAVAIAQSAVPANGQWFVAFHLAACPKERQIERKAENCIQLGDYEETQLKNRRVIVSHSVGKGT